MYSLMLTIVVIVSILIFAYLYETSKTIQVLNFENHEDLEKKSIFFKNGSHVNESLKNNNILSIELSFVNKELALYFEDSDSQLIENSFLLNELAIGLKREIKDNYFNEKVEAKIVKYIETRLSKRFVGFGVN